MSVVQRRGVLREASASELIYAGGVAMTQLPEAQREAVKLALAQLMTIAKMGRVGAMELLVKLGGWMERCST